MKTLSSTSAVRKAKVCFFFSKCHLTVNFSKRISLAKLIPALGEAIRKRFSPKTRVLCNFMPYYGPHLEYYARREVAPNLCEPEHWKPMILSTQGEVGGIVWMGDDDAKEIVANLPPGTKEFVNLESESFCVWTPASKTLAKGGRF